MQVGSPDQGSGAGYPDALIFDQDHLGKDGRKQWIGRNDQPDNHHQYIFIDRTRAVIHNAGDKSHAEDEKEDCQSRKQYASIGRHSGGQCAFEEAGKENAKC